MLAPKEGPLKSGTILATILAMVRHARLAARADCSAADTGGDASASAVRLAPGTPNVQEVQEQVQEQVRRSCAYAAQGTQACLTCAKYAHGIHDADSTPGCMIAT